jgi:hypothetical protein
MATVRKILGQYIPASGATDVMYTVPASTQAVVSSIVCCNIASTDDKLSIGVIGVGDTIAAKNVIYYQLPLTGYNTFVCTIGITLGAGDMIAVYSLNGNISFSVFGQEIT